MSAPGYDISLSGSSSAGASLSGATDFGANYILGPAYGPGGLILTDQRGSIGAAAGATSSVLLFALLAAAAIAAYFAAKKLWD